MRPEDYRIAKEFKRRLCQAVPVIDVLVFGSRARGDHESDSDMDISIEMQSLDREIRDRVYDIAWEVGLEYMTVLSPLIFTHEELTNSPLRSSSIVHSIQNEGVRI